MATINVHIKMVQLLFTVIKCYYGCVGGGGGTLNTCHIQDTNHRFNFLAGNKNKYYVRFAFKWPLMVNSHAHAQTRLMFPVEISN